jgi:hypothetical protein
MSNHEPLEPDNPESGSGEPAPLSDDDQMRKDVSYSPSSEAETESKQEDPLPETLDEDIDADRVNTVPGTGGPDDPGDVDVDSGELNLP